MPVLPLVASTRIFPDLSSPRRSPSRTIDIAARSFTLPPGLYHSALASTCTGATGPATRLKESSGVLPIKSSTDRPATEDSLTVTLTEFTVTLEETRRGFKRCPSRVQAASVALPGVLELACFAVSGADIARVRGAGDGGVVGPVHECPAVHENRHFQPAVAQRAADEERRALHVADGGQTPFDLVGVELHVGRSGSNLDRVAPAQRCRRGRRRVQEFPAALPTGRTVVAPRAGRRHLVDARRPRIDRRQWQRARVAEQDLHGRGNLERRDDRRGRGEHA